MKVLLTGATGLLGSHVLEQGLQKGHSFKVISRKVPKRSFLAGIQEEANIDICEVDLTQEDTWPTNLLEGIDLVINCAALASPFEKDIPLMKDLNLEAPKKLFQKAKKAQVKKWVQISSVSTLCDGQCGEIVNESFQGQLRNTVYAQTKLECDQWLDKQEGLSLLTLHPCYMLGKYDCRPSSGAILFALRMKKIQNFISNYKNFVDASDVAKGIWQGIEKEATGHFLLGNENASIEEFVKTASELVKIDFDSISFHDEATLNTLDIPEAQKAMAKEFSLSCKVNIQKAKETFNYMPEVGLKEMIANSLEYFQEKRMLRIR